MAEFIGFQPNDFFNTKLYTGNNSTNAITGVGFEPALTWLKYRNGTSTQTVQASTLGDYYLSTNGLDGKTAAPNWDSFDADGFTVSGTNSNYNASGNAYVSWNWKAGTTSGITGGTITPTSYDINTTSGIGMYQYAGSGTNGATIAHGLGVAPEMVFLKRTSGSAAWYFGHHRLNGGTNAWNYGMFLNDTAAEAADTGFYNTAPTSSVVTLGNVSTTNNSGQDYMMYAFVGKKGYSKFGGFTGNSNADGPFIYTGFRPAFFCVKRRDAPNKNWAMWDDKRDPYNVAKTALWADTTGAETVSGYKIDFCSNGIKIRENHGDWNTGEMVYMAFAKSPIVSSNDIPGVAR